MMFDSLDSELRFWNDEILDSYVLHIPHSSTLIPNSDVYLNDGWMDDVTHFTDWASDMIFDVAGVDKVIFPYSRVWCDVERFDEAREPMYKHGHGRFYTHNLYGEEYRLLPDAHRLAIDDYNTHHAYMKMIVESKLAKYNTVTIIDCHTFPDTPTPIDENQLDNRPLICLGTNEHTDQHLLHKFKSSFESFGYTVGVNTPYAGSYVPEYYYDTKDYRVRSIMVEINRKLYMDGSFELRDDAITLLNKQISSIFGINHV